MNRELFGVFGGIETFERFRSRDEFDAVYVGSNLTVGIRDPDLGATGWSTGYAGDDGYCVVWGEVYPPDDAAVDDAARWLYENYQSDGRDALSMLNGSYLAVVEPAGADPGFVATDPVRSRPCFHTDSPGVRVFGSDSSTVAATIPEPTVDRNGALEFLHLGVALGEKTSVWELRRLPIDSLLTATAVESLDRFVYEPTEFDYVGELADRLERALERRSRLPGRKGVLLSAGYDSRIVLSQIPEIERSYTVGTPDAREVRGAKRVATQYDASHTALSPDERYLLATQSKVRYGNGIKESLHIHHAGYTDEIDVDVMYHGLLCDTFLRGHFTATRDVEVMGKAVPTGRLDPDPDPVETLLERFGYAPDVSRDLDSCLSIDVDSGAFARAAVEDELAARAHRTNSVQNALTCVGIANQPSLPFHNHLADHFLTSFLATDRELIDWHLKTPPAHRTTETFLRACERLDDDILRYRPPDRPHDTSVLNEIERFVRRKTPFVQSFQHSWPDRRELFDRHDLDRRLLDDLDHLHDLPPRHKLRVVDIATWLECWSGPDARQLPWLRPPTAPSA